MVKLMKKASGKPKVPNMDKATTAEIQEYNRKAMWTKGFKKTTQANTTTTFDLQLGGSPRVMFGIVLFFPAANVNDDDRISLKVNEDTIVDDVIWKSYNPQTTGNQDKEFEFYELPRALSGNDAVQLIVNSVNAHDLYIVFYLANQASE